MSLVKLKISIILALKSGIKVKSKIVLSKKILFEGDGYSDSWEKEAAKRGLSNFKTTPEAIKAKVSKQALDLFLNHRSDALSHLFLSHLSKDNNCPDLVEKLFTEHANGTEIVVASRLQETSVYHISA